MTSPRRTPAYRMQVGVDANRLTRIARERVLSVPGPIDENDFSHLVRPEIISSWRRCQINGIDPGASPDLPFNSDHRGTPSLVRAATPVLEKLVSQLENTAVTLADSSGWLLWRGAGERELLLGLDRALAFPGSLLSEGAAGTNGLGTVLEAKAPLMIAGSEHYLETMQSFTCVGVPLRNPLTKRLEGVLALTCKLRDTNELLLPLIVEAGRQIERRLFEASSTRERALFEAFVRVSRTPAMAVATLNEEMLITNSQAAQLFDPADHALLWDWARECIDTNRPISGHVTLSRDTAVHARCTPVEDGPDLAGVTITMTPQAAARTGTASPRRRSTVDSGPAWRRVQDEATRAAGLRKRIMLSGESGTGKGYLAYTIHREIRPDGALLVLDCGAYDRGSRRILRDINQAELGADAVLVLRHVESLDDAVVPALAELIDSLPHLVVLTGRPAEMTEGCRHRIMGLVEFEVEVPPLRQRKDDIPALVSSLIATLHTGAVPPRCSTDALAALMRHSWPGNVSELRRILSTALVNSMHSDIVAQDLPAAYRPTGDRHRNLARLELTERDAIIEALKRADWNRDAAAADLGISRATIYRKIKHLGIRKPARAQTIA